MIPLIDADQISKRYWADDEGNIYRKKRVDLITGRHHTPYTRKYPEKKLKPHIHKNTGYKMVGITLDNGRYCMLAHRVIALLLLPNPHNRPEINHLNLDKTDNRLTNLAWCTRAENSIHAVAALNIRGENVSGVKLTNKQVMKIHCLLLEGFTQTEIAEGYNVTNHAIYRIAHGYNWSWLTGRGRKEVIE